MDYLDIGTLRKRIRGSSEVFFRRSDAIGALDALVHNADPRAEVQGIIDDFERGKKVVALIKGVIDCAEPMSHDCRAIGVEF